MSRSRPAMFASWLALTLSIAQTLSAQATKPIDASVADGTTTLQQLGSSPALLKVPDQLRQEHRAGEFAVAKKPPSVDFALLPLQKPIPGADTWLYSAWGDIAFGSDGNFYVAMGDHQALPGHSWVFQVDPASRRIRTVVDVNKVLKPAGDTYGPGKIHAPMIDTGEFLYFMPYRGSKKYCDTKYGFRGEHLMRYRYETGLTEDLGIPIPNCSVPQMNYHAPSRRLYMFGAWCPAQTNPKVSRFAVYDLRQRKTIFLSDRNTEPYASLRCMLLAPDGRAWYMTGHIEADERGRDVETYGGRYAMYDPEANAARLTDLTPPAGLEDARGGIRAATYSDRDGIVWCISKEWGSGTPDPLHGAIYPFNTKTGRFGKRVGHLKRLRTAKRAILPGQEAGFKRESEDGTAAGATEDQQNGHYRLLRQTPPDGRKDRVKGAPSTAGHGNRDHSESSGTLSAAGRPSDRAARSPPTRGSSGSCRS